MRRIICTAFGSADDLVVEETSDLEAAPEQVVIDVKASGVNFVDALMVGGKYQVKPPLPFTPGGEVAGTVAAVGDGVEGFAVGDRVAASCWMGGYASQVGVGALTVYPLPDGVSYGVGATFAQSYATAVYALTHCITVQPGESVLVLGAGGGVGRACVDVAVGLGARVIAAASSEDKRRVASEAGAEATIDPTTDDVKVRARELSDGGVDVVCDPVGGSLSEPAFRAMGWGGRFLVLGFAAGEIPSLRLNLVLLNSRTLVGVEWGAWTFKHPDENRAMLLSILDDISEGKLHPIEPSEVPLEKAAGVLRDIENRRVTGKVVLVP
jgi:NADPH:quinone reductase